MNLEATRHAGPDFLGHVAEQNLHSGLLENATEFRVRAAEWAQDKQTIEQQAVRIMDLQDAVQAAKDRLADIQRAVAAT